MNAGSTQTTFAATITVCARCGREATMIVGNTLMAARLHPCGHEPNMIVKWRGAPWET